VVFFFAAKSGSYYRTKQLPLDMRVPPSVSNFSYTGMAGTTMDVAVNNNTLVRWMFQTNSSTADRYGCYSINYQLDAEL